MSAPGVGNPGVGRLVRPTITPPPPGSPAELFALALRHARAADRQACRWAIPPETDVTLAEAATDLALAAYRYAVTAARSTNPSSREDIA